MKASVVANLCPAAVLNQILLSVSHSRRKKQRKNNGSVFGGPGQWSHSLTRSLRRRIIKCEQNGTCNNRDAGFDNKMILQQKNHRGGGTVRSRRLTFARHSTTLPLGAAAEFVSGVLSINGSNGAAFDKGVAVASEEQRAE